VRNLAEAGTNRSGVISTCWECHLAGDGMSQLLTERYDARSAGVLSCDDRVVITGTLPGVCYADGMTWFIHANGVRIFDYPQFAMTLRDRVRDRATSAQEQRVICVVPLI
jgi:hypothetical protein